MLSLFVIVVVIVVFIAVVGSIAAHALLVFNVLFAVGVGHFVLVFFLYLNS